MSETWLLSAKPSVASTAVNAKVEFISNGESYDTLTVPTSEGTMGRPGYIQYYSSVRGQGHPVYFYFPAGWKNDAYRTVTFVSPLTDTNLKIWLASNGTKIGTNDYKRYYKNPILLGTGSYKYRPYTVLTPTVSLSLNLTGCSTEQTSMNRLGQTTITFTKQTGYNWPSTVQVTGATLVSWNAGTLVVEKATANTVTITVTCAKITYALTETLSNVTKTGTHPTTIGYGGTLALKYTADANYELPDSVTVAGATSNWTKSTGTLVVSNPTGDVTITITAVRITYAITENLTNVMKTGTHPTVIAAGQTLVLNYAAATGYNLPGTVTVTGATSDWKPATGVLTITNPTGAVTITIVAAQPKLATPTNVSVDGTVLSWNAVENAESYDVYVDGELYENTTGVTEYTATVKVDGSCDAINCPIKLYDGSDANGTLLTTINKNPSVGEVGTFSIKSGSLYIQASRCTEDGGWYQVNVHNETGDAIASTATIEVVPISSNVVIEFVAQYCLTGDTLITLADGSSKRIDQLTLADKVLSYNPDTMLLEPDEITYTDSAEHKTHTEYKIYTFADGTTVKTVHRHRFYNVERQAMVYLDEWKLGEHAVNIHGEIVALANEITCKTEIQHYTIFTKNQNYFANGLLSGNRYTKSLTL